MCEEIWLKLELRHFLIDKFDVYLILEKKDYSILIR